MTRDKKIKVIMDMFNSGSFGIGYSNYASWFLIRGLNEEKKYFSVCFDFDNMFKSNNIVGVKETDQHMKIILSIVSRILKDCGINNYILRTGGDEGIFLIETNIITINKNNNYTKEYSQIIKDYDEECIRIYKLLDGIIKHMCEYIYRNINSIITLTLGTSNDTSKTLIENIKISEELMENNKINSKEPEMLVNLILKNLRLDCASNDVLCMIQNSFNSYIGINTIEKSVKENNINKVLYKKTAMCILKNNYDCLTDDELDQVFKKCISVQNSESNIYNQEYFTNYVLPNVSISKNNQLILIDVEDLKALNFIYGHCKTDLILEDYRKTIVEVIDEFRNGGVRFGNLKGYKIAIISKHKDNDLIIKRIKEKLNIKFNSKNKDACLYRFPIYSYILGRNKNLHTSIEESLIEFKVDTKNNFSKRYTILEKVVHKLLESLNEKQRNEFIEYINCQLYQKLQKKTKTN